MKKIEEYKFSDIEICENGIRINVKIPTGKGSEYKTLNLYIKNEDIESILHRFLDYNDSNQTEEYLDEIQDANY